ncbi:MarR family transcriptional regulator [Actinoallomurus sp. NPDC052308]|uniref:MarR family winged helix-turn-helix transcriptional regulator n=1 Tax=Actinoallomurus sp. NPDC052308 TaxID=3155530 RepID=UPI003426ADE5
MASAHQPIDRQAAIVEAYAAALVNAWDRAQEIAGFGVSATQLRALAIIDRNHEMTISALAAELGTLLSSASRLCDRLEAAGLISRDIDPADRRSVAVSLSRNGNAVFAQLRERRQAEFARVLREMPAAAREALIEGMAGFHAAAGEPSADGSISTALGLFDRARRRFPHSAPTPTRRVGRHGHQAGVRRRSSGSP